MRGRPIDVRKSAVLLIAAVLLAGCDDSGAAAPAPPEGSPSTTPAKPTPSPTPTHRKLKPGAKGADVKALQHRLKELHYDPGKADGKYGPSTQTAVWAFQAVNRLKLKGTLSTSFWDALDAPKEPRPMAKKREKNRVDVDLKRQYLVLYKDGRPRLISHISSGSGQYYCAKDRGATVARCRYASTGTGDFRTGRRASGWETSPLGQLYNPIYFNGGIAFHGALDVPKDPASHGCVRMPMHIAEYFPDLLGTNVPVHVRRPGK
ncbi:murein L,D-transpeptidase [Actinomadura darangshiensis]|uniref:Murein L,D-transpeptidase n=1 Tax=Actinomadura darangshiensis TaxID=705336 RepID=A0A4R5BXZ3_9ACTN|nr:L,D-transpeptidase family protein [Actinomadura darangshiensis]TDD90706.1 murein L,D-transpeptidase [Actinomadura darangshiensis]